MLRQSKWSQRTIGSQGPKKGGGTHAKAEQVVSKDHRVSRTQEGRRSMSTEPQKEGLGAMLNKWSGKTSGENCPPPTPAHPQLLV